MSAGRHHPGRADGPLQATARVRHRISGRQGSVVDAAAVAPGVARVLFDGDVHAVTVASRFLTYLDEAVPSSNPRA